MVHGTWKNSHTRLLLEKDNIFFPGYSTAMVYETLKKLSRHSALPKKKIVFSYNTCRRRIFSYYYGARDLETIVRYYIDIKHVNQEVVPQLTLPSFSRAGAAPKQRKYRPRVGWV